MLTLITMISDRGYELVYHELPCIMNYHVLFTFKINMIHILP